MGGLLMGGLLTNPTVVHHFDSHALMRMLAAGTAWGLMLAAGLFAPGALRCGLLCPGDVAFTTAISIVTGILTIGPLAAFHSRR
jgi:hypothetical protein